MALPQPAHARSDPSVRTQCTSGTSACTATGKKTSLAFAWRVSVAEQQLSCDHARRRYVHAHPAAATAFCCCCCCHLGS